MTTMLLYKNLQPWIRKNLKERDLAVLLAGASAGEPEEEPAEEWEEASAETGDVNVETDQPCTRQI
jgi:hypothetical protein